MLLSWLVAAHATEVPGTHWTLGGEPWPAGDVATLTAFAAAAPATWASQTVTLVRAAAAPLPDDLATPHTVATRRGRRITVMLDGLDERVGDWVTAHSDVRDGAGAPPTDTAAPDALAPATSAPPQSAPASAAHTLTTLLLRRQLGHALTHVADRGWSRRREWAELSGWSTFAPRRPPAEDRPWSFASPHGQKSAAEDLATLAERAWIDGVLPGESPRHPKCRMPTKWRQVEAYFEATSPIGGECPALEDTPLDPAKVSTIELVYVRASAASPASLAGHTLIAIEYEPDATGLRRRYSYGLQAVTNGEERGPAYVLRGLTGGYPSQVVWESWEAVAFRYTTLEDRDMVRFRLKLDEAQERVLLGRLDELYQGWRRPYLFFTRNCGQLPLELLESVSPEPVRLPSAFGPDSLLGVLERGGLLEAPAVPTLEETALGGRVAVARALREEVARGLEQRLPAQAAALHAAFRDIGSPAISRRVAGYAGLSQVALTERADFEDVDRYLAWSDPVELYALIDDRKPPENDQPTLKALRLAKLQNRALARSAGFDLTLLDTRAPLEAALAVAPRNQGSSHSPLRRLEMGPGVRVVDGVVTPTISLSTRLYETRRGESRRFPVAPGVEGTLMEFELQAGLTQLGDLRVHWTAVDMRQFQGQNTLANPGWYVHLLDLDQKRFLDARSEAVWLEAGPALELVQLDNHRFNLTATAGAAFHTDWDDEDFSSDTPGRDLAAGLGVGLPVRLTAWGGSAHQALSGVALEAEWRPIYQGGTWVFAPSTRAEVRVRIAEVGGADLALVGEHRTTTRLGWGDTWAPDHEARLSVWIEPN